MTAARKKEFKEYYAVKEADVTEAQIDAFCDAVRIHTEDYNRRYSYPRVPFLSSSDNEQREAAAIAGFDLDTFGNEEAVRKSPQWAAMVEPFRAANDAYSADRAAKAAAHREATLEAACAALADNPAIVRALRAADAANAKEGRGRLHDYALGEAFNASRLTRSTNPYGGKTTGFPAYTSVAKPSGCTLDYKRAVGIRYTQEQYADYSTKLIPVTIKGPVDETQARTNLRHLADSLQTHNGWAGSGSTHSFSLHIEEDGAYVVMESRHSISD